MLSFRLSLRDKGNAILISIDLSILNSIFMNLFPDRLKVLLDGRSSAEFARAVGVPQPMIHRYLKGKSLPTSDVLYRICKSTGGSADWLLGLDDNQKGGHSITANNSAVSIHGNASNQDCSKCEFMKAAIKKLNKQNK